MRISDYYTQKPFSGTVPGNALFVATISGQTYGVPASGISGSGGGGDSFWIEDGTNLKRGVGSVFVQNGSVYAGEPSQSVFIGYGDAIGGDAGLYTSGGGVIGVALENGFSYGGGYINVTESGIVSFDAYSSGVLTVSGGAITSTPTLAPIRGGTGKDTLSGAITAMAQAAGLGVGQFLYYNGSNQVGAAPYIAVDAARGGIVIGFGNLRITNFTQDWWMFAESTFNGIRGDGDDWNISNVTNVGIGIDRDNNSVSGKFSVYKDGLKPADGVELLSVNESGSLRLPFYSGGSSNILYIDPSTKMVMEQSAPTTPPSISTPDIYYVEIDGDDGTAEVGNPAKPFATAQEAYNLANSSSTPVVIEFGVGSFTIDISSAGWNSISVRGKGTNVSFLTITDSAPTPDPDVVATSGRNAYSGYLEAHQIALTITASGATGGSATGFPENGGNGGNGGSWEIVGDCVLTGSCNFTGGSSGSPNGGIDGSGGSGGSLILRDGVRTVSCVIYLSGGSSGITPGSKGSLTAQRCSFNHPVSGGTISVSGGGTLTIGSCVYATGFPDVFDTFTDKGANCSW